MDDINDHRERRCPRLGGPVSFHYCRITAGETGLPCFKVIDCWWESFDVAAFFKTNMTTELFDRLVRAKPKPKMLSILELIEQAKKRNE